MKRVFHIIASMLEAALLIGAYALSTLAKAKLGLNRWLVYHNQRWEDALPLEAIGIVAGILLAVLLAWSIALLMRSPHRRRVGVVLTVLAGILTIAWFVYALGSSADASHAYYLVSLMLALAALLQSLQALASSAPGKSVRASDGGGAQPA